VNVTPVIPPPYVAPPPLPHEGDQLATAVLRSLGRSRRDLYSLPPLRAMLLGWVTLGIAPVYRLARQFRDAVALENQQLWHTAEWIRTRAGGPEGSALADEAKRLRHHDGVMMWVKLLPLGFVITALVMLQDRLNFDTVMNATYSFGRGMRSGYVGRYFPVFVTWNVFVGGAYLLHCLHVQIRRRDLRPFVEKFNVIARREGIEQLPPPRPFEAPLIGWVIGAIVLCMHGAWWTIGLAFAGSGQRDYVNNFGEQLRAALVERVHAMLLLRRPAMQVVPAFVISGRQCPNRLCQAPLRTNANFCARCGSRAPHSAGERPRVSEVA
jgi:hypothetical protein